MEKEFRGRRKASSLAEFGNNKERKPTNFEPEMLFISRRMFEFLSPFGNDPWRPEVVAPPLALLLLGPSAPRQLHQPEQSLGVLRPCLRVPDPGAPDVGRPGGPGGPGGRPGGRPVGVERKGHLAHLAVVEAEEGQAGRVGGEPAGAVRLQDLLCLKMEENSIRKVIRVSCCFPPRNTLKSIPILSNLYLSKGILERNFSIPQTWSSPSEIPFTAAYLLWKIQ